MKQKIILLLFSFLLLGAMTFTSCCKPKPKPPQTKAIKFDVVLNELQSPVVLVAASHDEWNDKISILIRDVNGKLLTYTGSDEDGVLSSIYNSCEKGDTLR